jgi:hypothetical protein
MKSYWKDIMCSCGGLLAHEGNSIQCDSCKKSVSISIAANTNSSTDLLRMYRKKYGTKSAWDHKVKF